MLEKFLRKVKSKITRKVFNTKQAKFYFSQAGEDVVLERIFLDQKKNGFYVDIGSYHPYKLSNTYLFYLRGWKGINVDPRPGSKKLFDKLRPNDINLEVAVSTVENGNIDYYQMPNELTRNSLVKPNIGPYEKTKVTTQSLASILNQYLDESQKVDFLSIDCEGYDLEVLNSNNWEKYNPEYILIERNFEFDHFNEIKKKLEFHNYILKYSIPVNEGAETLFFQLNR